LRVLVVVVDALQPNFLSSLIKPTTSLDPFFSPESGLQEQVDLDSRASYSCSVCTTTEDDLRAVASLSFQYKINLNRTTISVQHFVVKKKPSWSKQRARVFVESICQVLHNIYMYIREIRASTTS
jgi:hypothetical protein